MVEENTPSPRLLYSIAEFRVLTGLSKTRIFEELKAGHLRARKCGRRTLIPAAEVEAWIASLEGRRVG
jgi:excisionase family DNA binding protein